MLPERSLLEAKALGVHDGEAQAVEKLGVRVVLREQEGVEASVRGGQLVRGRPVTLDEALEVAQTPDGRPV